MNTREILSKSIAWISCRDRETALPAYEVSNVLNSLNDSFFSHFTGLEVAEGGEIRSYYRCGGQAVADCILKEDLLHVTAPEEVYFLTQVILNTLDTEPDRFHDMFDIPGLEMEEWARLAGLAQYLIAEGWIESKAGEERLLIKLTIEGELYLRNNNALSC
ncbi:hypothetical protein AAE02nite_36450 [Adhaeribacter aerolatus]|uniref:Uncharacterized protein n=1 Tax=Adhaeribacter aerolatus TaxID=670289 RepID=A0A512B1Z7_9BACT|nr:hypothetical protein [Adhaeribacter aerolatus]GEO05981.1 hypothetical protein AAE02nite_36450 [Adhaeribacter aerolatus]